MVKQSGSTGRRFPGMPRRTDRRQTDRQTDGTPTIPTHCLHESAKTTQEAEAETGNAGALSHVFEEYNDDVQGLYVRLHIDSKMLRCMCLTYNILAVFLYRNMHKKLYKQTSNFCML